MSDMGSLQTSLKTQRLFSNFNALISYDQFSKSKSNEIDKDSGVSWDDIGGRHIANNKHGQNHKDQSSQVEKSVVKLFRSLFLHIHNTNIWHYKIFSSP